MRNSIYFSKNPVEFKADLLLKYDKDFDEVWCYVPHTEKRRSDLDAVCRRVSEKYESHGLVGVLYYYDVLGNPYSVFHGARLASGLKVSHNLGVFFLSLPAWKKNYEYSQFMLCIADFIAEMERTYGNVWLIELNKRSDSIYVKLGFNDDAKTDPALFDPFRTLDGNDIKFLCDCGQFKNRKHLRSKCDFALDANGHIGTGFYYNDIKLGCSNYVSRGNGRFFKKMGCIDSGGHVSDGHSSYSYYVRASNINEKKINVLPHIGCSSEKIYKKAFHSVEEFALERAAAGGLRIGDACYMHDIVIDSSGEKQSVSCIACWDGSKWVDYYKETEIKDWPASELAPGWSLTKQAEN